MEDKITIELNRKELMDVVISLVCQIADSCDEKKCERLEDLMKRFISKLYE